MGRYSILKTLGKGSNAKVKLAVNNENRQQVALKVYKMDKNDPDREKIIVEEYKSEVEVLSQIKHPHIINMIEVCGNGIVVK